jgi:SAM-dependent methyltransferase
MTAPNPWSLVPAADYEAHMGKGGMDQLAPLSAIFGKVYAALRPARLALLGCATGNGLEHVDPAITRRVVGVDVNIQYLAVARQRYLRLGSSLELYCEDALRVRLAPASLDLVHAALLFEHVEPAPLAERAARWLAPGGALCAVLQLPDAGNAPPPANPLLARVAAGSRLVVPAELTSLLARQGLDQRSAFELPVAHGRRLFVGLYTKARVAPQTR